tara:strand:- start:4982 stop:5620 length:639 start_codon:yes stop_codon:yes gene_type:complete
MRHKGNNSLAFLDLLFNTLLCFVVLFAISFLLINPVENNKKIDVKAEYLITVSWPKEMKDDIDVYVEDPLGNIIYFKKKEAGLMHLDRDDLGHKNDIVNTSAGSIEYNENREVVTFRGVYTGEYIINVHVYSKYTEEDIPVTVDIEKLNPYKKVLLKTVTLSSPGEEKTVCRLRINSNKDVDSINYLFKSLTRGSYGYDNYRDQFDDYLNNY